MEPVHAGLVGHGEGGVLAAALIIQIRTARRPARSRRANGAGRRGRWLSLMLGCSADGPAARRPASPPAAIHPR